MIDYNKFMIDKLKEFAEKDSELQQIIPKNFDYNTKKEEFNIYEEYTDTNPNDNLYPCITVSTLQNMARGYNISNIETTTDIGWQITIYAMGINYNNAKDMCRNIAMKISNFVEKELRFNRVGISPLMPLVDDQSNQIYSISLRYNAQHNLLTNKIKRR